MAIGTYAQLKTAVADWMDRTDISGSASDFVTLAEARLNRELFSIGTTTTLTGAVGVAYVSIASLSMVAPTALFVTDEGGYEYELTKRPLGTFTINSQSGLPSIWAIEGTNIVFDAACDQPYSFRFAYQGRFALSDAVPTNDLLTESPDIYLAACIVWGSLYVSDDGKAAKYSAALEQFMAEQRNITARKKRGVLTVDPALKAIGRTTYTREI